MKEAEIRPTTLLHKYLELSAKDAEKICANPSNLIARDCPGCGSKKYSNEFQKNGFNISKCSICMTIFVNPAPTDDAIELLYTDSPSANYWANVFMPAVLENRKEKIFKPRANKILQIAIEHGSPPETVVDVGAGSGHLIQALRLSLPDAKYIAVEPGAAQLQGLTKLGIDTIQEYILDVAKRGIYNNTADLTICCELIEHIVDTRKLLLALTSITKPGGLIILTGIMGGGFDIEVLGKYSNAIAPPHHLTFLTKQGIEYLVRQTGLQLVSFETPGKLDVDIVKNTITDNPDIEIDNFLRKIILDFDDDARNSFQQFIVSNHLSSHMWVVLQAPKK